MENPTTTKTPKQQISYVRDWIYGGIDGTVTTFAVVAGVAGSHLATIVIIILGVANLIADGFSMAAGNYLGTKSEHEEFERLQAMNENKLLVKELRTPWKAALSTFIAFIVCGAVPLLPYFTPIAHPFFWSVLCTGVVFFLIGSMKSHYTLENWWTAGAVTLLIGAAVAFIAYGIGSLFHLYLGINP